MKIKNLLMHISLRLIKIQTEFHRVFVFQCRRGIEIVYQKIIQRQNQKKIQICKKKKTSKKAFRVRKSTREKQKIKKNTLKMKMIFNKINLSKLITIITGLFWFFFFLFLILRDREISAYKFTIILYFAFIMQILYLIRYLDFNIIIII